jgi:hypothetical protein
LPKRGVGREGQKERNLLGEAVVGLYDLFFSRHTHVDVLAEDYLPLCYPTEGLYDPLIALLVGYLLIFVEGEGVGSGGGECGLTGCGPRPDPAPEPPQIPSASATVGARWGLYLQDRLEELVGDGLLEILRQARHDLLYLRDELARGSTHDVQLLLDP